MSQRHILLSFAIGALICALLTGTVGINGTNSWVPIAALFIVLALFALVIRSALGELDEKLRRIEAARKD